jgi:hypothetical protein
MRSPPSRTRPKGSFRRQSSKRTSSRLPTYLQSTEREGGDPFHLTGSASAGSEVEAKNLIRRAENFEGLLRSHVLSRKHLWRRFDMTYEEREPPPDDRTAMILRLYKGIQAGRRADALLHFSSEELSRLFDQLGYPFEYETIPKNIDYYMKRTSHGNPFSGTKRDR